MKILDEIISVAIDDKSKLSTLLRKCLLLAHELKDDAFKDWVNHELNGYAAASELPDYRKLHIGAYGNFDGPFGASLRNYPIPAAALESNHESFATKLSLFQPISAYEAATSQGDKGMSFTWPGNLCLYYQDKLYDGYVLVNAWQSVSKSTLVAVLDSVRNRTLNMALELKQQLGEALNFDSIPPSSAEKVHETIRQNIFNGPTYISSDTSSITVNSKDIKISVGSLHELETALQASGLGRSDVRDLELAVQADGGTFGSKVNFWIKQNATKLLDGGMKIGTSVAQNLLTDWLKQYFGMK